MNFIKKIIRINKRVSLKTKIVLLLFLMWVFSFFVIIMFDNRINRVYLEADLEQAATQTVNALEGNLDAVFRNTNEISDIVFFDSRVQDALSDVSGSYVQSEISSVMDESINKILVYAQDVDSAIVVDRFNNSYRSTRCGPLSVSADKIYETDWYKSVMENSGDFVFVHGSEGVVQYTEDSESDYIMLARTIKDINTYGDIAILMIIIREDTIQQLLSPSEEKNDSFFCIMDNDKGFVIHPENFTPDMAGYFSDTALDGKNADIIPYGNDTAVYVSKRIDACDWEIAGIMPILSERKHFGKSSALFLLIILLNLFFVILCTIIISRLIFSPLNRLQRHMKKLEGGNFSLMKVDEDRTDEMSNLKRGFNQMVEAIKALIDTTIKEEKIIAENELDLLQAQINPHFLYNTLDAVSALALLGDNDNCLKMTQALGSFYRNMLNGKNRMVTVQDEIECIQGYMTIINIRYDNKIKVQYHIDEDVHDLRILKLILQPVVENAVHHGVRAMAENAVINISARRQENELVFTVSDNGVGMEERLINSILRGESRQSESGFGLYSSIQRISLYYGITKPIDIISHPGEGTKVIIHTRILEEGNALED